MKKKKNLSNDDVLDVLDELEKEEGSRILAKTAPLEEHVKHSICRIFVIYLNRKKIRPTDLKELLNIPKTRISDIVNYKTKSYSLDRLFSYAEKLAEIDPQTREHLALTLEVLEGPIRTVSKARKAKLELKKMA